MILLLDRLPLYSWVDPAQQPALRRWSVSLPALMTHPTLKQLPAGQKPQRWVLDTAFTGDAFAWRPHLLEAGLDPHTSLVSTAVGLSAFGQRESLAVQKASVWLFSNVPALQDTPFRLALSPGLLVRDATPPDPEAHCPLLGVRALLRAGLRVKIDFGRAIVSVWVPGPWPRSLALTVRRCLSGFRTLPPPW